MKTKIPNVVLVWKQFTDVLVPRLRFSSIDQVVYFYLFRHTRLEGRLQLQFSMEWLARGTRLCDGAVRPAVRRLVDYGVFRLIERSKAGHVIEVRLPEEVPVPTPDPPETCQTSPQLPGFNLEEADFMRSKPLSKAIHARECGFCFYCLRRTDSRVQCIDHVVPQARSGRNSYRNLVSCCAECNSQKGQSPAPDFLRGLYRDGRLTAIELTGRLRALEDLAAGRLLPPLPSSSGPAANEQFRKLATFARKAFVKKGPISTAPSETPSVPSGN